METKKQERKPAYAKASVGKQRIINLVLILAMAVAIGVAATPPVVKAVYWFQNEDGSLKGTSDKEEDKFSFTDFKGGLTVPESKALDPSLQRAKDLREFIRTVLDFALGFLGIIAVAIVIYGGFLYVTSAGNEEQSGKGKKAITAAAIGIVIILGSFLAVQAIIGLDAHNPNPVGDSRTTTRSSAGDGGSGGAGGGVGGGANAIAYNLGAIGINSILEDFMAAYKNLVAVTNLIEQIKGQPQPHDLAQNRDYLSQVRSAITQIRDKSNSLSKTHVVAQKLLDTFMTQVGKLDLSSDAFKNGEIQQKFEEVLEYSGGTVSVVPNWGKYAQASVLTQNDTAKNAADEAAQQKKLLIGIVGSSTEALKNLKFTTTPGKTVKVTNLEDAVNADFSDVINNIVGKTDANTNSRIAQIKQELGPLAELHVGSALKNALDKGTITEADLQKIFAGIDTSNNTISDLFKNAMESIQNARGLTTDPTDTALAVDVIKNLSRLYIVVRDIPFTEAVIKASVVEGSYPLIVELNGTDSTDPTNKTIPDTNYVWDSGTPAGVTTPTDFVTCDATNKAIITCTYKQPGTYVVGLTVKSGAGDSVGAGEAHLSITVTPRISKIVLKAKVGDSAASETIMEWNGTTTPVSENEFHMTAKEAKSTGVVFNASDSTDGTGQPDKPGSKDGIKSFNWSFGDNTRPEQKSVTSPHKYSNEGRYTVRLEVTDSGSRVDRKIFDVVIGSIAARIGNYSPIGEPDQMFEFDGSGSVSDSGGISIYAWTVLDNNGADLTANASRITKIDPTGETKAVFRIKFKTAGVYKVNLSATDAAGKTDTVSTQKIAIKSKKPRTNFTIQACPDNCPDPTSPGLVNFDSSGTFDPDPIDTNNPYANLNYTWTFFDQRGNQLIKGTNFDLLPADTELSGKDAKKLSVKFKEPGIKKATLKVVDSEDPEIAQEDTKEKTFNVTSTLEGKWDGTMTTTASLTAGGNGAEIIFKGTVLGADSLSIDYGDNTTPVEITPNPEGTFESPYAYTIAGEYLAVLKATSGTKGAITMKKHVSIAAAGQPLAVINVSMDNKEIVIDPNNINSNTVDLEILRNKPVTFNAGESINSKGLKDKSNLDYSWDFGDGAINHLSTESKVTYKYTDVSPEGSPLTVTLNVTDKNDATKQAKATIKIKVVSKKPTVNTLSLEKITPSDTAPLDVQLTAEGAEAEEGGIKNYQFWYFTPQDRNVKMAVVGTPNNHAILTVETSGEEGTTNDFLFCVSVTDKFNASSQCSDMFTDDELPKLTIKNGPNKAPIASFTTDHTNIKVGDSVTFTSNSTDPDGTVKQYVWDFEGDGFANDTPTEQATFTYTYDRKSPAGGFKVKLKAIDDKNAAGYTNELPIYVTSKFSNPTAGFTSTPDPANPRYIYFTDASIPDTVHGASIAKRTWYFDTAVENGCDVTPISKPTYCSEDKNPSFLYPTDGPHRVKSTVEDSDGNTAELVLTVNITTPVGSPDGAGAVNGTGTGAVAGIGAGAVAGANGSTIVPVQTGLKADLTAQFGGILSKGANLPLGCDPTDKNNPCTKFKELHILSSTGASEIALSFGNSTGEIASYSIDKNILYDTDTTGTPDEQTKETTLKKFGDGTQYNDIDYTYNYNPIKISNDTSKNETYNATDPSSTPGHFLAQLTVTDTSGKTSKDWVEIIFDGYKPNPLSGSLFNTLGTQNTILLSLVSGVLVVLAGWGISTVMVKGKRRV